MAEIIGYMADGVKGNDLVLALLDYLGFEDLTVSQVHCLSGDLIDCVRARELCGKCPGVQACPWKGHRPSPVLEPYGTLPELTVRYFSCDSSIELQQENRQHALNEAAGIPERFRQACLDRFDGTVHEDARRQKGECMLALKEGYSLVLASWIKGNGKTMLACSMGNARLVEGRSVRFWNVRQLLDAIKESFDGRRENPMNQAQTADFLILDDLGSERATDWTMGELYGLVNHRYNYQLQTIFTTNFEKPQDLAEALGEQGERIVSRMKEMGFWVPSKAPDYRSRARQKRLGE